MQNIVRDFIYKEKYSLDDNDSWIKYQDRILKAISSHVNYEKYDKFCIDKIGKNLSTLSEDVIKNDLFYPAGRILLGVGREENRQVTLMNCFVLPSPVDSMEGIFDTGHAAAEIYKYGGGVGIDLSTLRPDGVAVSGAAKTSTGAWSWARMYSNITGMVGQAGRRGALLLSLSAKHPDILKFIRMKTDLQDSEKRVLQYSQIPEGTTNYEVASRILKASAIQNANLSVCITDDIMQHNNIIDLVWNGKKFGSEKSDSILKAIADASWNTGEPGVLFIDNIKKYSNSESFSPVVITNPCGEQPLPAHGACDLGSLNLPGIFSYCKLNSINMSTLLKEIVAFGVILLDMVHDWTKFPLPEQAEVSMAERRIGLGIMGLADFFLQNNVLYGSKDSIKLTEDTMKAITTQAYWVSSWLSEYVGEAPAITKFGRSAFVEQAGFIQKRIKDEVPDLYSHIIEKGLRNITVTSIAPTGSISLLAGVSSGLEPIMFPVQSRNILGKMTQIEDKYWAEAKKINPKVCVTYKDVALDGRLSVQGTCQKWVDSSVSSTVNLAQSATVEDVIKLYRDAWKMGIKGLTVYREGGHLGSIFVGFTGESNSSEDKSFIRPFELPSKSYRFDYDGEKSLYMTVSGIKNNPSEVFCALKPCGTSEYLVALCIQASKRLKACYGKPNYKKELDDIIGDFISLRGDSSIFWKGFNIGSPVAFIGYALDFYRKGDYWKLYNARYGEEQTYVNLYGSDIGNGNDLPEDAVLTKCPNCKSLVVTKGSGIIFGCDVLCPTCGYAGTKCGH